MNSMRLHTILLILAACIGATLSFSPNQRPVQRILQRERSTPTKANGFLGEPERDKLTRDSEPEQYFQTNTDKMSDAEKLPIALAGVAFITVPFIAGLIALYASK